MTRQVTHRERTWQVTHRTIAALVAHVVGRGSERYDGFIHAPDRTGQDRRGQGSNGATKHGGVRAPQVGSGLGIKTKGRRRCTRGSSIRGCECACPLVHVLGSRRWFGFGSRGWLGFASGRGAGSGSRSGRGAGSGSRRVTHHRSEALAPKPHEATSAPYVDPFRPLPSRRQLPPPAPS